MSETVTIPTLGSPALPRVGVFIPSSDTGIEIELGRRLDGIASLHYCRIPLASVELEELEVFLDRVRDALPLMMAAQPDLLVIGCTSASFVHGRLGEAERKNRIETAAGVPVVFTAAAVAEALRLVGRRVRLRTTYLPALTDLEAEYFAQWGLTITSRKGLSIVDDNVTAALGSETLTRLVAGVDNADVVMLSCTNLRTLGLQAQLEQAAGCPVVTSVAAMAAAIVRKLVKTSTKGELG